MYFRSMDEHNVALIIALHICEFVLGLVPHADDHHIAGEWLGTT